MKKILLIEDDEKIRKTISILLNFKEYEIVTAENGNAGLQILKDKKPDLVICDINLPDLSGYEILEEHKKKNFAIPFIFLTAKNTIEDLRKGMRQGADDYIPKPFKVEDLLASIKTRLEKSEKLKEKIVQQKQNENNSAEKISAAGKKNKSGFEQIKYIRSKSEYSEIVNSDGKKKMLKKSLSQWESELDENFFRVHRSILININFLQKIELKKNGAYVYLTGEENPFEVSQRKLSKFKEKINH